MVPKRPVPKDNPIPFGVIPYGRCVDRDGLIYSIDKFRPRFYATLTKFKPDNIKSVLDGLAAAWFGKMQIKKGEGRVGSTVYWWSFDGVLVSLCKRDVCSYFSAEPSVTDEDGWTLKKGHDAYSMKSTQYNILLEFNPNKHMYNPVLSLILDKLREVPYLTWENTRCDYTLDIQCHIDHVRLLSRKMGSCFMGTYYFGQRGQSGYTRVYDKRKEMREKYRVELGHDVTRIEWEIRGHKPVVLDQPYMLGYLGNFEVLRYVPMDRWMDALRTYDPRTAKKIKQTALLEYPFDRSVYDDMYRQLVKDLGLDQFPELVSEGERMDRDIADLEEAAELEKLMSEFRKFAQIKD